MTAFVDQSMPLVEEIDALWPKPKKKRGSPERSAQVAVVKYLRTVLPAGSIVAAVKNEHGAGGRTAGQRMRFGAKRKAEGVTAGFPDLVCLLPGGRVVLLEMKAPKTGRLSDAQRDLHAELRRLGFPVAVATGIDTAEAALREAGVPLRASRLTMAVPAQALVRT